MEILILELETRVTSSHAADSDIPNDLPCGYIPDSNEYHKIHKYMLKGTPPGFVYKLRFENYAWQTQERC